MSKEKKQFDLIVIGGGPGGYGAALYASAAGLEDALVENAVSVRVNVGFIPAKELLKQLQSSEQSATPVSLEYRLATPDLI